MTSLKKVSLPLPSWLHIACLISILGISGCANLSALIDESNTIESEKNAIEAAVAQPAPPPPPSLQDVEEAISSTKALLDDQQKQIGNLLSLRGEVNQNLREFRDKNLVPMNAAIETLQHQVGEWEDTSATDQETLSSTIESLAQDLAQAQTRVGVYGEQVTALVDQIDQNNRQYDKLLTEFQNSLVGFKGAMGEFNVTLTTEKERATQQEGTLANQLKEQQQTLDQEMPKPKDILELQKRLNQLHVYINKVRDTVSSQTTALQAGVEHEAKDNLREMVTSLEQRYQQLTEASSANPELIEHLQTLQRRVEQSEQYYAETVKAIHDDNQAISVVMPNGDTTQETEQLQTLVTSLEQRYQQLTDASPSNPVLTEQLQALEQRMEQSEKHYTETVKALHKDIQEISVDIQRGGKAQEAEKLQALVSTLEQRYQQLAHAPSSNPALTKHLKALEQRVEQSEINSATTIKALQNDLQTVSTRMATLTQSIGAETVEALHHDIEEVSAGMLKLAQSISHLEQTKMQTKPIRAGSVAAPRDQP